MAKSKKQEKSSKENKSEPKVISPEEYRRISGDTSTSRMTIFGVPNVSQIRSEKDSQKK